MSKPLIGWVMLALLVLSGCNYHYHRGLELEKQGRYEEANIEFHRAYTQSPSNESYRDAYWRTAMATSESLMQRYDRYIQDKQYRMAFRRLEQAKALTPDDPRIEKEMKKWYRILIAGRIDLVEIRSLKNQIPLVDEILLTVRINTPDILRRLEAPVDYQNDTFSVEDIIYDPPQDLLMMYSINAIGVTLINHAEGSRQFKKFIDFKTPIPTVAKGRLTSVGDELKPVEAVYPVALLEKSIDGRFWYPARNIRYSLKADGDRVRVNSSINTIAYLPQLLYLNRKDRRVFLDFGQLQLSQSKIGGTWSIRRVVDEQRVYLYHLQKNVLLNTYFFYREGGYPFVLVDGQTR